MTGFQQGERLWVCHACQMIGTWVEATAHRIVRGHEIEELSQEISDGIREEQAREQVRNEESA